MQHAGTKTKQDQADQRMIVWCLISIGMIAFLLRIGNLAGPDIAGDDALYAMRSIGWVDYVAATNRQSTPVSWFAEKQWWQGLSFHDAPPLVFAVQWIFFKLGGDNPWAARLPFVLAGMLAILAIFLAGRQLAGAWAGLASAAALGIMNYAVFASRTGVLDGFLVLWIALACFFFLKAERRPINYLWWGAALGAGLLTKYTFVFVLPVFLFVMLLWRRPDFKKGVFCAGIALCFFLLTPVIIYNVEMFKTRGHPDAALSTLIGQHPSDFSGLTREFTRPPNPFAGFTDLAQRNFSVGLLMLLVISVVAMGYRVAKDKTRRPGYALVVLGAVAALLMLTFLGVADRFGMVLLPFIALLLGSGSIWIIERADRRWRIAFKAFIAIVMVWEVVFAIQTQWLAEPIVRSGLLVAANRPIFMGYHELDQYVENFYRKFPEPSPIVIFKDDPQLATYQRTRIETNLKSHPNGPFQKHLLVFDDRMRWFAWVWIFERRRLYDADPIHSIGQFIEKIETRGPVFYTSLGLEDVTIIVADDHNREDAGAADDSRTLFVRNLEAETKSVDEIRDADGHALFKIFRLPLALGGQAPAPATRSPQ